MANLQIQHPQKYQQKQQQQQQPQPQQPQLQHLKLMMKLLLLLKSYIDAGTCNSVSANSNCGDGAGFYLDEFTYNGKLVVVSSKVPDHEAETDQLLSNPNTRCEGWQYAVLPLNPTKANNGISTSLGTGGAFFNTYDTDLNVAMAIEGARLDSSFGHSAQRIAYHYHAT